MDWGIRQSDVFPRRLRDFGKKHAAETASVLRNADKYHRALEAGASPKMKLAGFMHPEPKGVWALDQTGADRKLREMRLYVWPQEDEHVLWMVTLGDKNSQDADIGCCREFVARMRRGE